MTADRQEAPLLASSSSRRQSSWVFRSSVAFSVSLTIAVGGKYSSNRRNKGEPRRADGEELYAVPFVEEVPDASVFESLPEKYRMVHGGKFANLSASLSLCSEFDDDQSFPSDVCDCGDARTQCNDDMLKLPRYHDLCFDAACGKDNMKSFNGVGSEATEAEKCDAMTRPAWGVPCAWQAVMRLPETCAGRFVPSPPFGASRNVPNKYPSLSSEQRWALGYEETFAGPCNAHAFCFTCLDDDYELGVNPYCAAVFATYGATPEAASGPDPATGLVKSFFSDLETHWCQPHVLDELKRLESEQRIQR